MTDIVIEVPEDLSKALMPYRDHLDELLRMGLREFRSAQSLGIYQRGGISLWKAARMAGVSLKEMGRYAASQGVQVPCDEEMVKEELA